MIPLVLVDVGIKVWSIKGLFQTLVLRREAIGPTSEVRSVVYGEDALVGRVHVVGKVTVADGDRFHYGTRLVDNHDYGVEKVTFVEVPNFFGLHLEEHGYPLSFFFIGDAHAAVLVGSG